MQTIQDSVIAGDLYIAIFNAVLSGQRIGHGREGYYFGENGEHTLYDIGKSIGHVLVDLGKSTAIEPTTFTHKEIEEYLGVCLDCNRVPW